MDTIKKLKELSEKANEMGDLIKEVKHIVGNKDYDLERLLKSIEADYMDMKHKINISVRLGEDLDREV